MNKYAQLLFMLFITCNVFGQVNPDSNADSLRSIWNNTTLNDTSRLNAFQTLIWDHYSMQNPDSTIILGQQMLDYSILKKYKRFEAMGYNLIANGHIRKSEYQLAKENYEQGILIAEQTQDSLVLGRCIADMGNIYMRSGDHILAYKYFSRGLQINRAVGNQYYELYGLGNLANVFLRLNNNKKAETLLLERIKLNEVLQDAQVETGSYSSLGNVYLALGDTLKAIQFYENGLKSSEYWGFKTSVAIAHANLAGLLLTLNRKEEAIPHITALKIFSEESQSDMFSAAYYWYDGELDLANGKNKKAIVKLENALQLLQSVGMKEAELEVLKDLYGINRKLGYDSKALQYHEDMVKIETEINKAEAKTTVQRVEFQSQLFADSLAQDQKDLLLQAEHETEVRKKNKTKNIFLAMGLFLFLIAGGLYSRNRYIKKSKDIIEKEKDRSDNLLLNILPAEIAEELKINGKADARDFDKVSILFTDFKEFTRTSEKLSAKELVAEINTCFEAFDAVCGKYKVEKIKTIGDAYMAAGGLPVPTNDSVKNTILAALEMQEFILKRKSENQKHHQPAFEMRVGIHTGPVVAGIVGVKKFQYDIWGDTVNTASRMESNGKAGKVNISQSTYELINNDAQFTFESRGKITAKGKGELEMYFVKLS